MDATETPQAFHELMYVQQVCNDLPIEAFAGGHQGLVEVRQGRGSLFDCLQVQGVAALQVVMRDGAQTVRCWTTCAHTNNRRVST